MQEIISNGTSPGARVQRTMRLLSESTPKRPRKVKIIFYGQSISRQDWWRDVADYLRSAFPYADLDIRNKAVGGFNARLLARSAEHDIYPLCPDLIILHCYGGEPDYEEFIKELRSKCSAELLVHSDHIVWRPSDGVAGDMHGYEWHNQHCFEWLPAMSEKYGFELAEVRGPWGEYLDSRKLKSYDLLTDGMHLNDEGNRLLAALIKRHLVYIPELPADPYGLETVCRIGKDFDFTRGKALLKFSGSRVEAIASRDGARGRIGVRIDGVKPSQIPGCYAFTRPNDIPGKDWPWQVGALVGISRQNPLIQEEWLLRLTEVNEDVSFFRFEARGSKTGFDGTGNNREIFVSDSGRVVIHPEDWWLEQAHKKVYRISVPAGYEIRWKAYFTGADVFVPPSTEDLSREYSVTLAQGLPDGEHLLEMEAEGAEQPGIEEIRVYRALQCHKSILS
ncbi:MAG: SGNH/GDSL hydrolase family protein [Bacillota bacterium]